MRKDRNYVLLLIDMLIAAALLIILPEVMRVFALWRFVIYGLMFVMIMLFKPEGLLGYKEFSIRGIVGWVRKIPARVKNLGRILDRAGGKKDG